jgi:hypothetical protein
MRLQINRQPAVQSLCLKLTKQPSTQLFILPSLFTLEGIFFLIFPFFFALLQLQKPPLNAF